MTTNSPNPVVGDVQALIERLNRIAARLKWNNIGYAQDVLKAVDLLTTPPAQILRPVELPGFKKCPQEHVGSQFWIEINAWNEAVIACAETLRQQGYEVKS
ncbi:hypothetical protein [Pantoea ananatis]|uniref:hypothetical protein n=1 Tax=Pantoea ananas TaxID=553 RepID=UPI000CF3AC2D|nr:hypothetical protein [Pantoea ananatis]PQL06055.1 hypothetical protein CG436_18480 [Pantoea ananatis]